jgi:hypothetical protein
MKLPHHRRPMNLGAVTLLDQNRQLSRIHIGVFLCKNSLWMPFIVVLNWQAVLKK